MKLPSSWKLLISSASVGAVGATALGAIALALSHLFHAASFYYMTPGIVLVPVVGSIIPSRLMDWLVPDGGPAAGIALMLGCALIFWTVCFGTIYFAWARSRRKRSTGV